MSDIVTIGECVLYNGDCCKFLNNIEYVDLCFADPPYNNGTKYNTYIDQRPDYQSWCETWFHLCRQRSGRTIITPGHGNLWMWGRIEQPWGMGCWYKPGNPASSVIGWVCWEPWLYYCKDYRALGGPDTIKATVSKQKGIGSHPCPKPFDLMIALIEKTTQKGQTVLDPFMGSGTTAIAAIRTGRKFIGIELDESYFKESCRRIEAETKQMRMF